MSNLIFPTFNGGGTGNTGWNYTWPIKKSPKFNTTIQTPASGRGELRIANQTFPLWNFIYDISYLKGDAQGTNSAWQRLVGFYMAVQGSASSWLFLDPFDNQVTNQTIGVGDGVTKQFAFYRQLTSNGGLDLLQNFVSTPTVFNAGVPTAAFTTDPFGNLNFTAAPAAGHVISFTGNFYFRCRFDEDTWSTMEETLYQIWEMGELKFSSVLI